MKSTILVLMVALALAACEGNSSSKGDGTTTATAAVDGHASILGRPARAPQMGAVAGGALGVAGAAAQSTADFSASPPQAGPVDAASGDPLQNFTASTAAPTMIIRTGQAFIEVEKVDPAVLKIRQLAAQFGGYITNSSIRGGDGPSRQEELPRQESPPGDGPERG